MCGIFGQISIKDNLKTDKKKFFDILSYLNHRGPDDNGIFFDKKIAFGHTRLSIIDLTKSGRQPMLSSNKNHVISFNGEIYNYKELRKDLIKKGYKFFNSTDTEVLLNGIIDEGIGFVKKCNGMFAFAYHDIKSNVSYISRDRIGIKPLFYNIQNQVVTFSSETKLINLYKKTKSSINKMSIFSHLSYRQPIDNQTYFNDICSLDPGHYIEISNNVIKKKKYWDFEKFFEESKIDKGEHFYINKLKSILKTSVEYKLNSDREVASLLSGGLDSSIISSLINGTGPKNFKAFSIGYSENGYNEFKYSSIVAKKFSMKHEIINSNSEEYFNDMEELIKIKGQPISIPNEVSQYRLCKEIKKHATVVLSGTGADELFCGYGRIYGSVYDYNKLKSKNYFEKGKDKEKFLGNFKKFYGVDNFDNQVDHFNHLYSYTNFELKNKILSDSIDVRKFNDKCKNFIKNIFYKSGSKNYLSKMQYFFTKYHLKGILERDDNSSMAASVELRVPFCDHRMVEFSATIPEKYKIKIHKKKLTMISDQISEIYDIPKYILRKAYDQVVPGEILNRPKIGFPVPLHKWLAKKKIKDRIFSVLTSRQSINRNIFNHKYINEILNDKKTFEYDGSSSKYQSSLASTIWMCYNLELFFKQSS